MKYESLDNHFSEPKTLSHFFNVNRIPRKMKKNVKKNCGSSYDLLDVNQKLWYSLGKSNPNYKIFLIKLITKK